MGERLKLSVIVLEAFCCVPFAVKSVKSAIHKL